MELIDLIWLCSNQMALSVAEGEMKALEGIEAIWLQRKSMLKDDARICGGRSDFCILSKLLAAIKYIIFVII